MPRSELLHQRGIRHVRPRRAGRAAGAPRKLDARPQILSRLVPGERRDPELAHPGKHRLARLVSGQLQQRLVFQHDGIEQHAPTGDDRLLARVPLD